MTLAFIRFTANVYFDECPDTTIIVSAKGIGRRIGVGLALHYWHGGLHDRAGFCDICILSGANMLVRLGKRAALWILDGAGRGGDMV